MVEGSQGDGVDGHVVLPHEVGQLLPRHHLVLLGQLVHGDQLIAGRQRGLGRGVEWGAGVKRRGVGGARPRRGHGQRGHLGRPPGRDWPAAVRLGG